MRREAVARGRGASRWYRRRAPVPTPAEDIRTWSYVELLRFRDARPRRARPLGTLRAATRMSRLQVALPMYKRLRGFRLVGGV
jgi:hypothetical protein